jgi:hypothetical protein
MHMFVRGGLNAICIALCGLALLSPTPTFAAEEVSLTILDQDVPLAGAEVTIFLADFMYTGVTNEDGIVEFSVDYGRGFWVEVNGERLADFYFVEDAPYTVDLAFVGTIDWPGR